MLQQLEKDGLIKYDEKGVHKGRIITPKGKSFLDKMITVKK
jgi:ribosomal protein S19E (S16A)